MTEGLRRTLDRLGDDALDIMANTEKASQVLDSLFVELTPVAIAYKMNKTMPSINTIQSAASKLVAILAATTDMNLQKIEAKKNDVPTNIQ